MKPTYHILRAGEETEKVTTPYRLYFFRWQMDSLLGICSHIIGRLKETA